MCRADVTDLGRHLRQRRLGLRAGVLCLAVGPDRPPPGLYLRGAVLGRLRHSLFPDGPAPANPVLIALAFRHRDGHRQRRHVRAASGLFRRAVRAAHCAIPALPLRASWVRSSPAVPAPLIAATAGGLDGRRAVGRVHLHHHDIAGHRLCGVVRAGNLSQSDIHAGRCAGPLSRRQNGLSPLAQSGPTAPGSCPSSAPLPASGPTIRNRRRR